MPFLKCPKCKCIPLFWDNELSPRLQIFFEQLALLCPKDGEKLKLVPSDPPLLDKFGYPRRYDSP
jgi:hypothetical protein